jgi:hypothetical protein
VLADKASSDSGIIDTAGHAYRAYDDVAAGTLVLIRPDGYIGLITSGSSAEPVYAYLRKASAS